MRQGPKLKVRLASDGSAWIQAQPSSLLESVIGNEIPYTERWRRFFGSSVTPSTIEDVIRSAELGWMRDLTDLIYESIFVDGNFGHAVGKRFRKLAAMTPRVISASGDGIDPDLADKYAAVVRQNLAWIPNLSDHIMQLNWGHCFGRSGLEKVWAENRAGALARLTVDRFVWVHPRRIAFGPYREMRLRDDTGFGGMGFEAVGTDMSQPGKFICYKPQLYNENPEREGFGPRALYWSLFKRMSWRERMALLEVFGRAWRIVERDPEYRGEVGPKELEAALAIAEDLGPDTPAVMPDGLKLRLEKPDANSGQIHRDVKSDADDEISKIVLGETRTSESKPNALGSSGDQVAQEEQGSVVQGDAAGISACLTEQFAADIILQNYGPGAVDHAPKISLVYEPTPSRTEQITQTEKVYSFGIPLLKSEVYEKSGFTCPTPEDEAKGNVIQKQAPPPMIPGGFGAPGADPGTDPGTDPADQASSKGAADGLDPLAARRMAKAFELALLSTSRR